MKDTTKKGSGTTIAQVVMSRQLYEALKNEADTADVSLSSYLKLLIAEARETRKARCER